MSLICLMAMTGSGVPAWIFAGAMLCDTILISVAMICGYFPHPH